MTSEFEFKRTEHCAVRQENCVIIFGGIPMSLHTPSTLGIWVYNLYTEEWRRYVMWSRRNTPNPFSCAVAVTIGETIYTFGGQNAITGKKMNELWILNRTKIGGFTWSYIKPQCKEQTPSPRMGHTGWV